MQKLALLIFLLSPTLLCSQAKPDRIYIRERVLSSHFEYKGYRVTPEYVQLHLDKFSPVAGVHFRSGRRDQTDAILCGILFVSGSVMGLVSRDNQVNRVMGYSCGLLGGVGFVALGIIGNQKQKNAIDYYNAKL